MAASDCRPTVSAKCHPIHFMFGSTVDFFCNFCITVGENHINQSINQSGFLARDSIIWWGVDWKWQRPTWKWRTKFAGHKIAKPDNIEHCSSYNSRSCFKVTMNSFCLRLWFLARDSMLSALYAIARPSVRLSVRPSVCHTGGSVKNGWS